MKYLISTCFAAVLAMMFIAQPAAAQQGQLEIWINGDKGYTGLQQVGDRFSKELGVPVKVEHPENPTDKFVQAAQAGKGPDIFIWAHDRLGEFADAGLLSPVNPSSDFRGKFSNMGWEGFTHKGQIWGYPIALEAIGLIYNKKLVNNPPTAMEDLFALNKQLQGQNKKTIMWDYTNTYFTWPFLSAGGGYIFGKDAQGNYNPNDIGVAQPGSVQAMELIRRMIQEGVLPEGATYSVMESQFNSGDLALMISGPWAWANLKKSGIDFGVAPLPTVNGKPSRPFVGVMGAMINQNSPDKDLAIEFLERYLLTEDGLRTVDRDVPLGVPALTTLAQQMAQDPNIKGTMQNVEQGMLMPNVPEMGRFWSAMKPAIANATSGQTSAQEALQNAQQRIKK